MQLREGKRKRMVSKVAGAGSAACKTGGRIDGELLR